MSFATSGQSGRSYRRIGVAAISLAAIACGIGLAYSPTLRPSLNPARATLVLPEPGLISEIRFLERAPGEFTPDRTAADFAALPWSANLLEAPGLRSGAVSWTVPAGSTNLHRYFVRTLTRDGRDCGKWVMIGRAYRRSSIRRR